LLIDNYDSFTWNLAHRLGELGARVNVVRNDTVTVEEIDAMAPERIVISPGPGRPETAGITVEAIRRMAGRRPVLGVCLGHQALVVAFGGRVERADVLVHGKASRVRHEGAHLFKGLGETFEAGRYHSVVVRRDSMPDELVATAWTEDDGVIMGIRHRRWPVYGVQFHPESVLTPVGHRVLQNFLESC
jgi:anthranilate synthase component 2